MDGTDIDTPSTAQHRAEVERRQARLQGHQQGQQARQPTIAFAKWMNQNQLGMHFSQGKRQRRVICRPTRRVLPKGAPLKLRHQARNETRMRKPKTGGGQAADAREHKAAWQPWLRTADSMAWRRSWPGVKRIGRVCIDWCEVADGIGHVADVPASLDKQGVDVDSGFLLRRHASSCTGHSRGSLHEPKRHCERSAAIHEFKRHGLPRRFAPRCDE